MTVVFLLLIWGGVLVLYLSHAHQIWRRQPLQGRCWRLLGWALILAGQALGLALMDSLAALLAGSAAAMLAVAGLPFFGLMAAAGGSRPPARGEGP
jgi:hypothetical protein